MLLLAGFLIAATAIMAIGAFSAIERTESQLTVREHQTMLNLFMNTRERAQSYFQIVTPSDTASSVSQHLDGYLFSQFQTAQSLSLNLNATLAGDDTPAWDEEKYVNETGVFKPDRSFVRDLDGDGTREYATRTGDKLWSNDGSECYSSLTYDGDNDGLITNAEGDVAAAIFWLKVESTDASLEEYIIIDVPGTDAGGSC